MCVCLHVCMCLRVCVGVCTRGCVSGPYVVRGEDPGLQGPERRPAHTLHSVGVEACIVTFPSSTERTSVSFSFSIIRNTYGPKPRLSLVWIWCHSTSQARFRGLRPLPSPFEKRWRVSTLTNICVRVCVRVFGRGGCEEGVRMDSALEELSLVPEVRHLHRALSFKTGLEGQWATRIVVLTSRGRGPRAVGSRGLRVTRAQRRSCVPIPGATAGLSPGGSWMAALAGCRHLGPQPGSCVACACLFLTPPGPSPHRMPPRPAANTQGCGL